MLRTIVFFIITASIFLFPWWVATIFMLVAAFYFELYIELLFFASIIDALYGYGTGMNRFLFTMFAVILIWVIPFLKNKFLVRS